MTCRPHPSHLRQPAGLRDDFIAEERQVHLTPSELALRWRISPRTLERWRRLKTGPDFHRMSGKITYATADVERFERRRRTETNLGALGHRE